MKRAFREKNEVKSLQRAKGRAQGARPRLRPLPRPLLACGQRGPRGGGGAVGSPRWALCGPRSPPRGTICSLSMHHLLVWAVARETEGGGRGEIKECVHLGVGTGCRGGGWAQFCLFHPGTGQAGLRGWGRGRPPGAIGLCCLPPHGPFREPPPREVAGVYRSQKHRVLFKATNPPPL